MQAALLTRREIGKVEPAVLTSTAWLEVASKSDAVRAAFPAARFTVADIEYASTTLVAEEDLPPLDMRPFAGTEIRLGPATAPRRSRLQLHEFRDVMFVYGLRGFVVFDASGVSTLSTNAPEFDIGEVRPEFSIEKLFFTGDSFNSGNICHYFYDHLSRAILYDHFSPGSDFTIGIVNTVDPFNVFVTERTAPHAERLSPTTVYHVRRLQLLSTSSGSIDHPAFGGAQIVLDRWTRAFPREALNDTHLPDKLYISRSDARRRRLVNEDKVEALLGRMGYTVVRMSEHPALDQFKLIHNARRIVSPHGANLTGIACARPGTALVEMFSPGQGTLSFYRIAQRRGVRYRAVVGRALPRKAAGNPWVVSLGDVEAAVLAAEAS